MPRKTEDREIKQIRYQITQVGANTGDAIIARLGLGAALDKLSPEDVLWVRDQLMASTKVEIVDPHNPGLAHWVALSSVYDEHFANDLEGRMIWLKEAWSVSFGPFFQGKKQLADLLKGLSNSISPKGAPGSSTDSSQTQGAKSTA